MTVLVTFQRGQAAALGQPSGPIGQHWVRLLADVDRRAKQNMSNSMVNVQTGNLRSSQQPPFLTRRGDMLIGVAQNVAKYAIYVHDGTSPHEIRAQAGKILAGWTYDGAPAFAPLVHHPGTQPRPFLRDAVTEAMRARAR